MRSRGSITYNYDTNTSSSTFGLPLVVYTHDDLSTIDQRQCAVTTYAPANASLNIAGPNCWCWA